MSRYRGFTVSFNSIGAGKILRKYLVLSCQEFLNPLLLAANINMVEAKCQCQITLNTRAVFRKGAIGTWIKFQLVQVVAPSSAKHIQAKRLLESLLPGCTVLEEYKDTAKSRLQYNEFVPDNKELVFNFHRNGITHHKYGEIEDLLSPGAPMVDKSTMKKIRPPWKVSKRECLGISLPSRNFPLQRRLNMISLLDMLLLGAEYTGEMVDGNRNNPENVNNSEMEHNPMRRNAPQPFASRQLDINRQSPPAFFGLV